MPMFCSPPRHHRGNRLERHRVGLRQSRELISLPGYYELEAGTRADSSPHLALPTPQARAPDPSKKKLPPEMVSTVRLDTDAPSRTMRLRQIPARCIRLVEARDTRVSHTMTVRRFQGLEQAGVSVGCICTPGKITSSTKSHRSAKPLPRRWPASSPGLCRRAWL
jgi:hypothetical protein